MHVMGCLQDELVWYVPLGLKDWFRSKGVRNVVELDWWQSVTHKDTRCVGG